MANTDTFIEKLEKLIDELYPIIDTMMDNSSIYYNNTNGNHGSYISIGAPVNHYSKKDEKSQLMARQKFLKFLESIELLLVKANPLTVKRTKETEKRLLELISQNVGVPSSTEAAKLIFRKQTEIYKEFLNLFKKDENLMILVPDTNALIEFPDPMAYRKFADGAFLFLILPTVLSELDKLKINHRNEAFREKAKSVIKRLKGYRNQGNVLEGVIVDKNITVKMLASEPNFEQTLKWLDPNNNDDRIVANALNVQIQNPADRVLLITSDINLQNKSQAALLSFADTDDISFQE